MSRVVKVKVCGCSNCMMHGAGEILEALERVKDIDGLVEKGQEIEMGLENFVRDTPHQEECPVVEIDGECYLTARAQIVTSRVLELLGEGE